MKAGTLSYSQTGPRTSHRIFILYSVQKIEIPDSIILMN